MQAELERIFYQKQQISTPGGIPVLNLKALTLAVVVGVLSPVVLMNVLNIPQVLAQSQDERKAEANRLLRQGIQQVKAESFQEALQSFQQALKIYQEIGDRNGEAKSIGNIGFTYENLKQYQRAIEYYEQALVIWRELGDHEREAISLGSLGLVYSSLESVFDILTGLKPR